MVFLVRHSSYTTENTDCSYLSFVVKMDLTFSSTGLSVETAKIADGFSKSELEAWANYKCSFGEVVSEPVVDFGGMVIFG